MRGGHKDTVQLAAAAWHLRLSGPVVDQHAIERFEIWRSEDASHRDAYDQVAATLDEFDAIAGSPEIAAMMEQTRHRVATARSVGRVWQGWAKVASVLLVCIGFALWFGLYRATPVPERFETAMNQRMTINLSDGSRLTLDSDTLVLAEFSADVRALRLKRGQARFRVAHDPSRPFRVAVRKRMVTATGTDFNIENLPGRSVVTLLKGGVTVGFAPPANWLSRTFGKAETPPFARLYPGQKIDLPDAGPTRIMRVDPQDAIAWERGWIIFDNEPLALALERFNRYNRRKVVLDAGLSGSRTVSGMFGTSNPGAFADAIAQLFNLNKTTAEGGTIRLSSPKVRQKTASQKN